MGNALLSRDLVENELSVIEANNPGNVTKCCEKMFDRWLETDKVATWKKLVIALEYPGVELHYLAQEIKNSFKRGTLV